MCSEIVSHCRLEKKQNIVALVSGGAVCLGRLQVQASLEDFRNYKLIALKMY